MKQFFNYIRYSNVNVCVNLNPFLWGFNCVYEGPTSMDPKMYFFSLKILFVKIALVIDDGSY